MRLAGACPRARRLGLLPGLAFADARARVPDLDVVEDDPEADGALMDKLTEWCDRYTPVLAPDPDHGLILEISGSTHLFGGEKALMADLARRMKAAGLRVRTALAGTPQAARALCRFGPGGIVPPGEERELLAGLPVSALEMDRDTTQAMGRAGLATLADLAERPRKPLAARFSSALTWKLAQVLGEVDQPIIPLRPAPDFVVEMRFADPLGLKDDIDAALGTLCAELCRKLEHQGQGGRHFEVSFFRADGAVRRLEVISGQPLRVPGTLARLIDMRLGALADPLDPGFGFDMIRLSALSRDGAPPAQERLDGEGSAEQDVQDLLDRLCARFGADAVRSFVFTGSHLPERAAKTTSTIEAPGREKGKDSPTAKVGLRPLLLLTPPEPIEVIAEIPHGPPRRFRWRKVLYDVALVEGPERIAPEWWRETRDRLSRDYFRVEDQKGYRFWLFRYGIYDREPQSGRWFMHGLFP